MFATQSAASLTAAVPSRLCSTPSKSKPLTGLRIAVKDLFDFRGIKTSGRNWAPFEMSEPKSTTAAAVRKLIDAGAVIVRKKNHPNLPMPRATTQTISTIFFYSTHVGIDITHLVTAPAALARQ